MATQQIDRSFAIEKIREIVEGYDPFLSRDDANMNLILDKMIRGGKGWNLTKPDTILPFIKQANLPMDGELERALSQAWGNTRFYRCGSYDAAVLSEIRSGGYIDPANPNLLESTINSLGLAQNWTRNLRGEQELAEQQRIQRRQRWISIISEGGKKAGYCVYEPRYGGVRWYEVSTLEGESDDVLESLAVSVPQLRAQIDGRTSPRPPSPTAKQEAGIVSTVPAQKTPTQLADDELLINPKTGQEYTAREIKLMSRLEYHNLTHREGQPIGHTRMAAITRTLHGRKFGE